MKKEEVEKVKIELLRDKINRIVGEIKEVDRKIYYLTISNSLIIGILITRIKDGFSLELLLGIFTYIIFYVFALYGLYFGGKKREDILDEEDSLSRVWDLNLEFKLKKGQDNLRGTNLKIFNKILYKSGV